jgi:hypothetical protein
VGKYRKGLRKYLEDLLEEERQGVLAEKNKEELEHNRHWAFLRRLIGEEIVERYGSVLPGLGRSYVGELAKSLAHPLGMTAGEAEKHLDPLVRGGNICPKHNESRKIQWGWVED